MAQRRRRIYIVGFLECHEKFNYPEPTLKKVKVKDFLDRTVDKKYVISDKLWISHQNRRRRNRKNGKGFGFKLTDPSEKCTRTISSRYYKDGSECLIFRGENRNPRKLTPREVFRLQGFPESFEFPKDMPRNQIYKMCGNSVSVPVIEKIFNQINFCIS